MNRRDICYIAHRYCEAKMILYCFTVNLVLNMHVHRLQCLETMWVRMGKNSTLMTEQLWILGHLHLMIFQHDEVTLSQTELVHKLLVQLESQLEDQELAVARTTFTQFYMPLTPIPKSGGIAYSQPCLGLLQYALHGPSFPCTEEQFHNIYLHKFFPVSNYFRK